MIFFKEKVLLGGLEIFKKFKIRIAGVMFEIFFYLWYINTMDYAKENVACHQIILRIIVVYLDEWYWHRL
jgi:hypothetical protein